MAPVNGSFNATDIKGTLTERTDSSEETTEVVEQMVMKITDKAAKSLENTTSTRDEALALEQEIKEALNSTHSKQGLIFLVQYVVVNLGCHDIQYSKLQQLSFCCRQKLLLLYGYIYIYSIAYLQEKKTCRHVRKFHTFTFLQRFILARSSHPQIAKSQRYKIYTLAFYKHSFTRKHHSYYVHTYPFMHTCT